MKSQETITVDFENRRILIAKADGTVQDDGRIEQTIDSVYPNFPGIDYRSAGLTSRASAEAETELRKNWSFWMNRGYFENEVAAC